MTHRLSSAYDPHGNIRAEFWVKSMKRLLRNNISPGASLDTDAFSRAIMEYQYPPDRDTGCSHAQIVFGHPIHDFIPMVKGSYLVKPQWVMTHIHCEKALACHHGGGFVGTYKGARGIVGG